MSSDYFSTYIVPAYAEWKKQKENIRLAKILASELNNIAEHFWKLNHQASPNDVANTRNIQEFRDYLSAREPAIGLVRDVADSHKHLYLDRKSAKVKSTNDVSVKNIGWGEGYGLRCGGGPIIAVKLDGGSVEYFDVFAEKTYKYWASVFT